VDCQILPHGCEINISPGLFTRSCFLDAHTLPRWTSHHSHLFNSHFITRTTCPTMCDTQSACPSFSSSSWPLPNMAVNAKTNQRKVTFTRPGSRNRTDSEKKLVFCQPSILHPGSCAILQPFS